MSINFDGRVAIVTGAGNGLGKSHAVELARLGAKVVVNDFGGARDGSGGSSEAAEKVVAEIIAAGGEAIADGADVSNREQVNALVKTTVDKWGRIDILVNNAGILRDKSFVKMSDDDWDKVVAVHLTGSALCSHAVWPVMREQGYGRIVMTTSTSGLYGNFGQANYGAAKMAVAGLMNTLHIEGEKYDIRVNCVAPTAATRMTEDLMPKEVLALLEPGEITPAVLFLASDQAPSRRIILAGAGCYAMVRLMESEGIYLDRDQRTPDAIAAQFEQLGDMSNAREMLTGGDHVTKILTKAAQAKGIKLGGR
ncbi:SDR family oxidoreductase [Alloalcanivorax mobilis]|uniref:SDR family oxidoreductase n=1 Tax=Alloalcanivorax mobilis TaxID=2019569 RepID=UPI000B5B15CA|nr:SDR family oxidoreductase [Alloalcanivorax mobilis]ASK33564.1 3-oxoacyl-ACP reductase [Alcanivorax sp. N3-2A]|tara:strand:- start:9865 stop:10791 length:927 start_codon:yes stop_codon:yes gene_type:complete